jgi:serine/threonine-protein kinase
LNPERWEQIQAILAEAEACPPEERAALLDRLCQGDVAVRDEVESLLAASSEAVGYFEGLAGRAITPFDDVTGSAPARSLVGRQVGPFRVVAKLGEGGMGEVYRATDTELRRDVALKVLPERLLHDRKQVARFKREAQLLASLNHPGIASIYGLREIDGRQALVLELVDGPTLAERMAERRLPRRDALEIAREVALALEAAHRHGVVHRDLKPSNVKLTVEGDVKVLDFGIAKAVRADTDPGSRSDASPATTDILAATQTGQVIGTVSYMSPEQLKGKAVDTRSDVWAFGAVLFEMLAGTKPFQAEGFAITLAKILEHAPDWSALPSDVSPRLRRLLERCLERDVRRRLQAIGEARIAIEDELLGVPEAGSGISATGMSLVPGVVRQEVGAPPTMPLRLLGALAVALAAAGLTVALLPGTSSQPNRVERYASPLRAGEEPVLFGVAAFNLSADGTLFVYRGPGDGGSGNRLWLRRWNELDAAPLRGTEGALAPSVSHDDRLVAFSQGGEIKVLSLAGGPVRTLAPGINPTWGPDGFVYMTTRSGTARVPSTGGTPEPITRREDGEGNHFIIDFLPDGEHALVSVDVPAGEAEIRVLDLASGSFSSLTTGRWPLYAETGHLVYLHDGSLMAAPFDPERRALLGPATPLVEGVLAYAMSDDGSLVYSTGAGAVGAESELVWVSRSGEATPVDDGWYFDRGGANPGWSLSPDGTRIALRIGTDAGPDIWIRDLTDGTMTRLTFHEGEDRKPRWAPDGSAVTFLSDRGGDLDVWSRQATGSGEPELLFDHSDRIADAFWSPDHEWLVLRTAGVQDLSGGRDIVAVRRGVTDEVVPLLTAAYDEAAPALSRDGRWLAYASTQTGRYELYVRPFPNVDDGHWQVTTQGGSAPVWAHNGEELFYVDAARRLASVRFTADPGFRVSGTETLFTIPPGFDLAQVATLYDVAPDDERFLMARVYRGGDARRRGAPEIVLVKNFLEELRATDFLEAGGR